MWDIIAGIGIILVLSVILLWVGAAAVERLSKTASACLAWAGVAFVLWFAIAVHGTLRMAEFLPFSNVIVLGNWLPPAAAFLAGMISGQRAIPMWRRLAITTLILCLAWMTDFSCFIGPVPRGRDLWSANRVCLQTTPSSCSACCAVMLLKHRGIPADEQEMIGLCLTGPGGTPSLGLYRGLKSKTRHAGWDVEVVRGSLEELLPLASTPAILLVRLDGTATASHAEATSWVRGARSEHAVVLYRFTEDGRAVIGDPAGASDAAGGCYLWSVDDLRTRWGGEGLRLVPRAGRV